MASSTMRKISIVGLILVSSTLVGCGDAVTIESSASANNSTSSSSSSGGTTEACQTTATSTLPGVSVEFLATDCTFTLAEAAAGIQIDYQIVVASNVPNVHPVPQSTGCNGAGSSLLFVFENLGSDDQNYCLCDLGKCPTPDPDPVTIPQGAYPASFLWDGRNWSGPSDFDAPKGPAFPPGDYTLAVTSKGDWTDAGVNKPYEVIGTVIVHLVP